MPLMNAPRRRDQLKRFGPFVLLLLSIVGSGWVYLGEDFRIGNLLLTKHWNSKTINYIEESAYRDVTGLTTTEQHSNMVFLPDNTYSRDTQIILKNETENIQIVMSVSESGEWEVSGGYLKLKLGQIKDVTTGDTTELSEEDLALVRTFYRLGAEKVRRIDVLGDGSLLLTSLNHGSMILYNQS
ncbi:transcriptional regulator [Enterovibrio norvegicus FF-454]|uniref:Transcriptional regulator n=1 Tax=Enterovibrio norvegicus FF-454 TaxID=1185651 RepID=A0A1E5C067_9GAMM|nr:regulatory protein ToxS [Enterovibrio norvegicus]OEE58831.1 transcriptional regulator [Enterovibrio norvegicus FF-454]